MRQAGPIMYPERAGAWRTFITCGSWRCCGTMFVRGGRGDRRRGVCVGQRSQNGVLVTIEVGQADLADARGVWSVHCCWGAGSAAAGATEAYQGLGEADGRTGGEDLESDLEDAS